MAAWKACVSGSVWVRRLSSTGVRSAPPPNQALVVTTKRVFMCTAGTCGLCRWAISEMPEAKKRGSASAPGISLRNSGANSPKTVEAWTPTFSNTRPFIIDITPPPQSGSALADPALEVPISGKHAIEDEAREVFKGRRPERFDAVEQLVVQRLLHLREPVLQDSDIHDHPGCGIGCAADGHLGAVGMAVHLGAGVTQRGAGEGVGGLETKRLGQFPHQRIPKVLCVCRLSRHCGWARQ